MVTASSLRDPVLINTIGHSAGVLLFGFIITLLLRDRHTHGVRDTQLSILAAALAFGWNVGSLIALGAADPSSLSMQVIMTASFAVLSLLPAVLLQVTLQGRVAALTWAGYAISGAAVVLHLIELFVPSSAPHQIALVLVAAGFAVLTVAAFLLTRRQAEGKSAPERIEWLSLACLLLFVISFPHFGYQHFRSPWAAEIAWHHIGIPVAIVVLLQNYRFLLLDTFIRFLMNSLLAVAYLAVLLTLTQRLHLWNLISTNVFAAGITLVVLCLSLALFAHVRNLLQQWIGRFLFHRQNLERRLRAIGSLPLKTHAEEDLISAAAREMAAHFRASRFDVVSNLAGLEKTDAPGMLAMSGTRQKEWGWAEAYIPLRFAGETKFLLIGTRLGRQRYLSEDLEDMRRLGSEIVEQVERFRSEELRRLATQAELRALQSQINPHFLFNAFNTLYGTIDRGSVEARQLVLNLTDIFRYFLQGDRSVIPLSEELRIIKAYLEIESLRLGDRLETELDIADSARSVLIPMLCLQPLVENAVKHGVAEKAGRGTVIVRAHNEGGILRVTVEDISLSAQANPSASSEGAGIGLTNVRRRLNLSYGPASTLTIAHRSHGSIATLVIPVAVKSSHERQTVEAG